MFTLKGAENSAAGRKPPEERALMRFHDELPGWNGMQMQTAWANGERGGCWLHESDAGLSEDGPPVGQGRLLRTPPDGQDRQTTAARERSTADPTATGYE